MIKYRFCEGVDEAWMAYANTDERAHEAEDCLLYSAESVHELLRRVWSELLMHRANGWHIYDESLFADIERELGRLPTVFAGHQIAAVPVAQDQYAAAIGSLGTAPSCQCDIPLLRYDPRGAGPADCARCGRARAK